MEISNNSECVMRTLRDHPWAGASHVAGLTGIPPQTTQRNLAELMDAGLIQTKRVPMIPERLHAPSEKGIVKLAGGKRSAESYARAFDLDAYHLAGTLLRAHTLLWARDFLVQLATAATGGSLEWAISPSRVRARRRLLRLDALGACQWRGQHLQFAVLADPGGLAVEGYVPIFERFARWAGNDDDAGAGRLPTLVILTTFARRAQQLALRWTATLRRVSGPRELEMFVGVHYQVQRDPARWWRAGTSRQGALWRTCRGSATPLPRPRPPLARRAGSPRVRVQDLDDWGIGTLRGKTLRHFLALSAKEWRTLHQVAQWPLLRSTGLALLAGYSGSEAGTMPEMMRKLKRLGLIKVVRESDAHRRLLKLQCAQVRGRLAKATDPASEAKLLERLFRTEDRLAELIASGKTTPIEHYVLAHRGLRLLAATRGMSPLAYAKGRLWPAEYVESEGRRVVRLRIARFLLAWKHTLLTNEFFLGLRRLSDREWAMGRNHQLLIWDSVECRRWFWDKDGRQLLLPDSGGVYRIGSEVYEFWLEIDRGHSTAGQHGRALRRKYERYYLYRRHPDAIYGRSMPRVLVVTPQIGRARQVREMVMALAEERREPPLPVFVTTLDDIWLPARKQDDGPLQPCRAQTHGPRQPMPNRMWPELRAWRRVDEFRELVHCFEGLGKMPPGTQRGIDLYQLRQEVRAHSHRSERQRRRGTQP